MNDFNFFLSFDKKILDRKKRNRRTYGFIAGAILLVVLFYGILGLRMFYYYFITQKGETFLNDPQNKLKITELQAKKEAAAGLQKYSAEVEKIKQKIVLTNKVSSPFLDKIQKAFPATVILEFLDIREYQLNLGGTAPSQTAIAELTHNLDETGLFTRVHVYSISANKDSAGFRFSILCDLKEVAGK